jgi:hypothetical protein
MSNKLGRRMSDKPIEQERQISKRWLNFFSSKSNGKKAFKNEMNLFANLNSWGDLSVTPVQPFNKWGKKSVRNEIDELLDFYDSRKGIKLTDPKVLSFIDYLPLSGQKINVGIQEGDFTITAKDFDYSKYNFLSLYGDLTQKISSLRNGKNASDTVILTYKQLEFFFHATKIAQHFSKQIYRNRVFMSTDNNDELSFRIDRNYLRLLLALETLQPHVVAQELFTFTQSIVDYIHQLEVLFFGLGVSIDKLYNLKELKIVSIELRNSLLYAHSNPVPSDGKIKDKEERETPAQEAGNFSSVLSGNQIGLSISSALPEKPNILRSLNYKDSSLTVNSSEFQVLESWILTLYRKCMCLVTASSDQNITSEEEMKINTDFVFDLLIQNLSSTEINVEGYSRILTRASHLKKTLKKKDQIDTVDEITKLVKACIEVLQRKDSSRLQILVGCLRNNPNKLDERLATLEAEFDVNAKWKQEIRTFELKIDSSIQEDDSLGSRMIKLKVEPQELHKELSKSIQSVVKSRERYIRLLNGLRTNNNMTANLAEKETTKLKKFEQKFKLDYSAEKESLIKNLGKSDADKRTILSDFGNRIKTITDSFFDEISRADAEAIITHSNAPGALMIGLGQGGEQIVRATLAKMLNNNTDTRCKNLLKGLNIDLEKLNDLMAKEKDSFDAAIPVGSDEKYNEIAEVFDNANLLAINAGPEQKTMLSQPYNYIWGTSGGENTKFDQKKDNFIKQSTNAILLDVGKKGSGGKMGKGRAYAVNAEAAISDSFRQKQEGKNIRQVCVVHSFAGGSGSGMILPVLRMIKQNLPGAMVWVFSAGETAEGSSTHDAENVVYITSDILQARYNALHYKEKEITMKEWESFEENASLMYNELSSEWQRISSHLPDLRGDDFENFKTETLSKLENKIHNTTGQFENFFALKKPFDELDNPFDLIADEEEEQQQFYRSASNTKSANEVTNIWRIFNELVEDEGSFSLKPLVLRSNSTDSIGQEGTVGYPTQFSHLKYICLGIRELVDNSNKDEARNQVIEKYEDKKEIYHYAMHGVEASINYDLEGVTNEFDAEDLEKLLHDYANKMRNYHTLLSNQYENIKLNLAAGDDPNIKHVIISNGHLDLAAKDIVPNRTQNYEIYNSIMTDTFLNLVHSIVENNTSPESNAIASTTTLSNEVMDLNDMSGRTNPTSNATLLSLPEVLSTQNDIHYSRDDEDQIKDDIAYKVFSQLFIHPLSPIMDSSSEGNYRLPGQGLIPLYSNYLKNHQGLRKFKVSDVIHSIQEESLQNLLVTEEMVLPFWESMQKLLTDEEKDLLEKQSKYGLNELVNSINWLKIINPKIIALIYGKEAEYFNENTKKWSELWKGTFENLESESNSPLNKKYRENTISNFIVGINPNIDSADRKTMTSLLLELGVIDASHFSAIPTSLIYDFTPILLKKILNPNTTVVFTIDGVQQEPSILSPEESNSYLNPYQIPAYDVAKHQKYELWEKTQEQLSDPRYKFELGLSIDHTKDYSLRYLKIKTSASDVSNNQRNNIYTITPEFMNDVGILKQACVRDYPEFASTTILNRLIVASPNINSNTSKRSLEEKPKFRRASEDIETNSQPKFLYPDETNSSALLRTLFFGNKPDNDRQKVLYKTQIVHSNSEWYKAIQDSSGIVYGKLFDTLKFEIAVKKRMKTLVEFSNKIQSEDGFDKSIELNVLVYICTEISVMEFNSMSTKGIFDLLFSKISKSSNDFISGKSNLNKTNMRKHVDDILNLLTRLSSLSFAAHRQHKFSVDSASKQYGVAYEFEGTLDAIRSMPEDWLWLVNSSTTIEARLLERTLKFFSLNYLQAPKNPKYKVFVQHLKNGPLAHLTLISQKAGFTEISAKYSQLMRMLSRDKFGVIKGPYVHPYSFLRNILWLHTFKNMWVNGPSSSFTKSLEIPSDVIINVFGKPHLVEVTEGAVMSSGDMKGINLSHYDTEMWRRAKETVYKPITEGDDEHYQERMKNQIHIPDMLLINYLRELSTEMNEYNDFDSIYREASNDGFEDLKVVYPAEMWKTKLDTLSLSQYIKSDKTDSDKGQTQQSTPPGMKIPGLSSDQLKSNTESKSAAWLQALVSWSEWYKRDD